MEGFRQVSKGQKALVYRFLKPHREDFIAQLEPDVKSVIFPPLFAYFSNFGLFSNHPQLHFWFDFQFWVSLEILLVIEWFLNIVLLGFI